AVIIESGVWKGFGTWILEQAAPRAEIHALDPIVALAPFLSRWKVGRVHRSHRVHYSHQDFSCAPVAEIVAGRADAVAVFDDHQNKLPRLRQCRAAGIRHIVFDDNFRVPYTHRTLEHEREAGNPELESEIERYEIFPALWPVDARIGDLHIQEPGMDFPLDRELRDIHRERKWHSYVTYVRLR